MELIYVEFNKTKIDSSVIKQVAEALSILQGNSNRIFVSNLNSAVTSNDLFDYFASYGNVTASSVIFNGGSGASLGYGFVEFQSPDCANRAANNLNDFDFNFNFNGNKQANIAICS